MTARRSKRSARYPARGDIRTEGIMAAKVTRPVHMSDPVRLFARAPRATISAHAEDCEHIEAYQSLR